MCRRPPPIAPDRSPHARSLDWMAHRTQEDSFSRQLSSSSLCSRLASGTADNNSLVPHVIPGVDFPLSSSFSFGLNGDAAPEKKNRRQRALTVSSPSSFYRQDSAVDSLYHGAAPPLSVFANPLVLVKSEKQRKGKENAKEGERKNNIAKDPNASSSAAPDGQVQDIALRLQTKHHQNQLSASFSPSSSFPTSLDRKRSHDDPPQEACSAQERHRGRLQEAPAPPPSWKPKGNPYASTACSTPPFTPPASSPAVRGPSILFSNGKRRHPKTVGRAMTSPAGGRKKRALSPPTALSLDSLSTSTVNAPVQLQTDHTHLYTKSVTSIPPEEEKRKVVPLTVSCLRSNDPVYAERVVDDDNTEASDGKGIKEEEEGVAHAMKPAIASLPPSLRTLVTRYGSSLTFDELHAISSVSPSTRCDALRMMFEGVPADDIIHWILQCEKDETRGRMGHHHTPRHGKERKLPRHASRDTPQGGPRQVLLPNTPTTGAGRTAKVYDDPSTSSPSEGRGSPLMKREEKKSSHTCVEPRPGHPTCAPHVGSGRHQGGRERDAGAGEFDDVEGQDRRGERWNPVDDSLWKRNTDVYKGDNVRRTWEGASTGSVRPRDVTPSLSPSLLAVSLPPENVHTQSKKDVKKREVEEGEHQIEANTGKKVKRSGCVMDVKPGTEQDLKQEGLTRSEVITVSGTTEKIYQNNEKYHSRRKEEGEQQEKSSKREMDCDEEKAPTSRSRLLSVDLTIDGYERTTQHWHRKEECPSHGLMEGDRVEHREMATTCASVLPLAETTLERKISIHTKPHDEKTATLRVNRSGAEGKSSSDFLHFDEKIKEKKIETVVKGKSSYSKWEKHEDPSTSSLKDVLASVRPESIAMDPSAHPPYFPTSVILSSSTASGPPYPGSTTPAQTTATEQRDGPHSVELTPFGAYTSSATAEPVSCSRAALDRQGSTCSSFWRDVTVSPPTSEDGEDLLSLSPISVVLHSAGSARAKEQKREMKCVSVASPSPALVACHSGGGSTASPAHHAEQQDHMSSLHSSLAFTTSATKKASASQDHQWEKKYRQYMARYKQYSHPSPSPEAAKGPALSLSATSSSALTATMPADNDPRRMNDDHAWIQRRMERRCGQTMEDGGTRVSISLPLMGSSTTTIHGKLPSLLHRSQHTVEDSAIFFPGSPASPVVPIHAGKTSEVGSKFSGEGNFPSSVVWTGTAMAHRKNNGKGRDNGHPGVHEYTHVETSYRHENRGEPPIDTALAPSPSPSFPVSSGFISSVRQVVRNSNPSNKGEKKTGETTEEEEESPKKSLQVIEVGHMNIFPRFSSSPLSAFAEDSGHGGTNSGHGEEEVGMAPYAAFTRDTSPSVQPPPNSIRVVKPMGSGTTRATEQLQAADQAKNRPWEEPSLPLDMERKQEVREWETQGMVHHSTALHEEMEKRKGKRKPYENLQESRLREAMEASLRVPSVWCPTSSHSLLSSSQRCAAHMAVNNHRHGEECDRVWSLSPSSRTEHPYVAATELERREKSVSEGTRSSCSRMSGSVIPFSRMNTAPPPPGSSSCSSSPGAEGKPLLTGGEELGRMKQWEAPANRRHSSIHRRASEDVKGSNENRAGQSHLHVSSVQSHVLHTTVRTKKEKEESEEEENDEDLLPLFTRIHTAPPPPTWGVERSPERTSAGERCGSPSTSIASTQKMGSLYKENVRGKSQYRKAKKKRHIW